MVIIMTRYNLIVVFSHDRERVLLCHRRKNPYLGMYNFVGGHIEPNETGKNAAYRELFEETSIGRDDITLRHLCDFTYYNQNCYVEVWCGRLRIDFDVRGDENELVWVPSDGNFFDLGKYAGEGNMGHIMEQLRRFGDGMLE